MKRTGIILILFLVIAASLCGCKSKEIDGNQWLINQESYMPEMEAFCENMDEVYTLYFLGTISAEDFRNELLMMNRTYNMMLAKYKEDDEAHPIRPAGHSYISMKGYDAVMAIRQTISDVMTTSVDEAGNPLDPGDLSYLYLAYKNQLSSEMAEYAVCINWLIEAGEADELKNQESSDAVLDKPAEPLSPSSTEESQSQPTVVIP